MKAERELYEYLKKMMGKTMDEVFAAIVKSVDKQECTCVIEFDELEIGDVRLKAIVDDTAGLKVFPAVGSVVLVQKLGDKEEYFITMYSEAEEVLYQVGTSSFKMNATGFEIKKGGDTLEKVMSDLIDQIKILTVTTNTGPSGVPINNPAFEGIKTRAKNLLK